MAVCSILYQLATRPEEQEKIHAELARVLPSADTPLTSRHLDQMQYLRAFVKEVFRMYSTVIGNGRTLQNDTVICGYRIPKGLIRSYRLEYHHDPLEYKVTFMYAPDGELKFKLIRRLNGRKYRVFLYEMLLEFMEIVPLNITANFWFQQDGRCLCTTFALDLDDLRMCINNTVSIIDSILLLRLWDKLEYRIGVCRVIYGA
ncbi:hypothetical protein ANN_02358 [Periplaneta americana]|uniref:Cytochrome P450 n=1 Tax=Periplaneta americana TaxID=6978 RepID=A0ABQ8TX61_PERAM|nr:hypothetical protein ANN_02358 [Periplaneta americana]